MKRNFFEILILVFAVLSWSCTSQTDERQLSTDDLEGNWYYIDREDTTYTELYFFRGMFAYNTSINNEGGFGGIDGLYEYSIDNDSLFYSYCCNSDKHDMRFLFKINWINDNSVELLNNKNHYQMHPLKGQISLVNYLIFSNKSEYLIDSAAFERGLQTLKDSGLYIPPNPIDDQEQVDSIVTFDDPESDRIDSVNLYSSFPEQLKKYIDNNLHDWHLPRLSQYYEGWENFYEEIRLPFYCSGDFNGDKIKDYACLLVSNEEDEKLGMFVFFKQVDGGINKSLLVKSTSLKKYQGIIPVGLFIEEQGKPIDLPFEESTLMLEYDGLVYDVFETSNKLFYYDSKSEKFSEYALSD